MINLPVPVVLLLAVRLQLASRRSVFCPFIFVRASVKRHLVLPSARETLPAILSRFLSGRKPIHESVFLSGQTTIFRQMSCPSRVG